MFFVEVSDIDLVIIWLEFDNFVVLGMFWGGFYVLIMGFCYLVNRMKGIVFNDIGLEIEMWFLYCIVVMFG